MARIDTREATLPKDEDFTLEEIAAGKHHKGGIEVGPVDIANKDAMELERFMNEPVTIRLAESAVEGDVQAIPVSVSGVVQWVFRGMQQQVKRKYVEVLARARTTTYKQSQPRFSIEDSRPEPSTTLSYQFMVDDDTPRGRAWLKEIQSQRA